MTVVITPPSTVTDVWSLELKDNGNASPDITTNDGIFSGAFVPRLIDTANKYNGAYKLFVTVKYTAPDTTTTTTTSAGAMYEGPLERKSSSLGKLFPVDQGHIGCGSGYLGRN